MPLGDVPAFRWMTDRDSVLISDVEARPFGGRFSAEATIPVTGGGSAEGSATFSRIDTAQLERGSRGRISNRRGEPMEVSISSFPPTPRASTPTYGFRRRI